MNAEKVEKQLMRLALKQADKAEARGDVPIGAIVVKWPIEDKPEIVARACNRTHVDQDPAGHAELLAIRKAAKKLKSWRLTDCVLVVTLEPCAMCAGAIVLGRVGRIIYGTKDPKAGACGSALKVLPHKKLNHRPPVIAGVLKDECSQKIKDFFKKRRKAK